LMGSPTSFPVLCLINAALTRESQELSGDIPQGTVLDDFPILINGDDVAFPTTTPGYEMWKLVTACGGLHPSIGKNFTSRKFLVMNSTLFETGIASSSCPCGTCGGAMCSGRLLPYPLIQSFTTRHWYNMDYLGPCGDAFRRTVPWRGIREEGELRGKRISDLASHFRLLNKKSRHHDTLVTLEDLFMEENYQILPELQKKWLGDSEGEVRHRMNEKFLSSWRDVLNLTNNHRPNPHSSNLRGQVPFAIDWFLPISLGGLGLENTLSGPRSGVRASSLLSRKLAKFLLEHPEEVLPTMPSLGTSPKFAIEIARRTRSLIQGLSDETDYIPRSQDVPSGYISGAQLMSMVSQQVMFSAHGNTSLGQGVFREGGDFTNHVDRTVALNLELERTFRSRAKYFIGSYRRRIEKMIPITDLELSWYRPIQPIYAVQPAQNLEVFVGAPEAAQFPRVLQSHFERAYSESRTLPSGRIFPVNIRLHPEIVREIRSIDPNPPSILPFSWPQYEPTSVEEWKIHALHRYRIHREAKEEEERKIGELARSSGKDLFGDSDFDSGLRQIQFL